MNVNKEELQRVINDLENNNVDLIKTNFDSWKTYDIFHSLLIKKWNEWNEMSKQQTAGKRRSSRKKSKKYSRKKSKRRRSRRRSRH